MVGVAVSTRSSVKLIASPSRCLHPSNKISDMENCAKVGGNPRSDCSTKSEVIDLAEEVTSLSPCDRSNLHPYKLQLEQDVQSLRQQLHEEIELHAILENAAEKSAVSLSNSPCLPHEAQELLSNIASLEAAVSNLEQQMVSLHYQLSQERNERRLVEYRLKQLPSQLLYSCSSDCMGTLGEGDSPEKTSCRNSSGCSTSQSTLGYERLVQQKETSTQLLLHATVVKPPKDITMVDFCDLPNLLSEEMVRCMTNIFVSLVDSSSASSKPSVSDSLNCSVSPGGHLSTSSLWSFPETSVGASWVQSPQVDLKCSNEILASEHVFDPYRVRGKLSWVDIGNYGLATEVCWMSVGKKQLEFAAGALRRFRFLVEQLAKVNPTHLRNDEKLAFWINLYNALIMHAYLAYGIPRSELKLFSLMQKAAYTVGGHSLNAVTIEYALLKMKPPAHRPQTALLLALHKLKLLEEQRKFAIDAFEPLVSFALSCGMYSSPAVRIYTAVNVREELQEAQRDFVRASVGVSSKGKLLVPKILHCFARSFVDDANLAVWIAQFLPPQQAALVEQCISQRRQSFLGSRNCGILPFDSRFRYIFLPGILS